MAAQTAGPCDPPNGNPIVCENQLTGNPPSEWDVSGSGDASIQGFATDISVNRGQTVGFKIDTASSNYRLDIYRMGYYGGLGARKIATVTPSAPLPQSQPSCLTEAASGLVDCGNWGVSASWAVPPTTTSGVYFAKVVRIDTGGASHIFFVVRDDSSTADLLFQTSDTTWQAYNQYGGNSLYSGTPGTNPSRAYKVSYNRPVTTRGTSPADFVFNAEYPMIRWLEANGYNIAYASAVDTDRLGAGVLQQHRVFLSVGHDEYWSAAQRANVEAARAAGVSLAFFSGNSVFWKTRWENSISASGGAYRTLVNYKETHANAKLDPNPAWTGTWRDPRFSPPADGGRPENALSGTIFMVNGGSTGSTSAITVPSADGRMRFWRGTSISTLPSGQSAILPVGTLGHEWDSDLDNGFRPAGLVRLSDTTVSVGGYLQDHGSTYAPGTANHALTLYRHPSGALVFGAGTIQWAWGLDATHDRGSAAPSVAMQQATINLLADMRAQPLTVQSGLTTASPSSDTLAPTSAIASPTGNVPANSTVTISGTATDAGGGEVGGVEVSVDGGTTWRRASGRASWSYSWQTGSARTLILLSRAVDDSGNLEVPGAGSTLTVGTSGAGCPCSIWPSSATPARITESDPNGVELGVKFRSDVSGYITAVRFYKGPQNVGPHTGHLWTASGTSLALVSFSGETATGWQQANFSSPVAITSGSTYVVSYHTASGFYSADSGYFAATGVDSGPLHALQNGVDGPNGVYRYGASGFPTSSYLSSNYWVDVVFTTSISEDTTPPIVSATTPANGASGVDVSSVVDATFSESMNASTITTSTFELRDNNNALVPAAISYAGLTARLQPLAALAYSTTYSVLIRGGSAGVKDVAGNAMTADYGWSFTTAGAPPATSGPGGPILVISSAANPFTMYYAEILRNEGLNAFTVADVSLVTATMLNGYDVAILGDMALTAGQVTMLSNWVTGGGNLIAMRPDKQLASLLGLTDAGVTLSDAYLQVNTSAAPGTGIVGQTMQFHGAADRYTLSGASAVATLYSTATAATVNPAVSLRSVGGAGGQAAAFTFDLARSIVFTRQGNPAWSGQERDGLPPIRSDDQFFGGPQPNYVDLSKVAIPQADEQQRLLANLIGLVNADRKPLPRFWYFPRGLRAVVVMTGDDHSNGGTAGRFDIYNSNSPQGCRVSDWECVRATSYIYPSTPISPSAAAAYAAQGYEIAAHVTTNCGDYTPSSLDDAFTSSLGQFAASFPSLPAPATNRTHCAVWSDYDTQSQTSLAHGIRLDTNYYYWPAAWVNNVPGVFTGSAMPMRFAKADGTLIDVYQATTQMTDESGQTYPFTIDTLLDRAIGADGYYGAFVANMHTDTAVHAGSAAIVSSAQARGVPVISSRQLLDWVDGRNGSSFDTIGWNGTTLTFTVVPGSGSNGLQTLLPAGFGGRFLTALTRNGSPVAFSVQTIKGVAYATFNSAAGDYAAEYAIDNAPPVISAVAAAPTAASAVVTWTTNEAATSTVNYGISPGALSAAATTPDQVTSHSVTLTGLNPSTTYYYRVTSADLSGNAATSPAAANAPASFTTAESPYSCPCTIWPSSQVPGQVTINDPNAIEIGVRWRPLASGFATGVRFYKGPSNTGVHTGSLWTNSGTLLATITFANESASGWQEALFSSPVAITANTTYVVSYHTNTGFYSADGAYFQTSGVTNGPLQALQTGVDGANGVYRYGASAFPAGSFNATNYWVDVVFATSTEADTTPPTVLSVAPAPGATDVAIGAAVTATFSENVDANTINTSTFQLRGPSNALVPGTVTYDGSTRVATLHPSAPLDYLTIYTARVVGGASGVKDPAANALAADFVWTFTTQPVSVVDTTAADFSAGAVDAGTYVSQSANGEVTLKPSVATEFSGTALPAGWSSTPWTAGGSASVANGAVSADGARVSLDATVAGGTLEFRATFSTDNYQHAGWGVTFNETPWAMFSTASGGGLYARTHDGGTAVDTLIPGSWLGTAHTYRIDWNSASVVFFIDGVQVANTAATIGGLLRPILSDFNLGGGALSVDWLRTTPYATSGTFTSRVLTTGSQQNWSKAAWTASVPPSTSLAMSVRFGNTATPDGSWTGFSPVPSSGSALSGTSLYVQYQAAFAGTGAESPVLEDVTLSGAAVPPQPELTITDVIVTETNTGTVNAVFTVTLSPAAGQTVTVNYATANGTATAPADYTATSGVLTFPAGTTTRQITVAVVGETLSEATEQFTVNLSNASGALIVGGTGTGSILDNDPLPSLSINNVTVTEGNTGTTNATFTVTLSVASGRTVTVNYATADVTAAAPADYNATSGILAIPAGTRTGQIIIPIVGDLIDESNETYTVNLSDASGATIASAVGTGTITDNDSTPSLSINNVSVQEGNAGTTSAVFTVTLSAVSGRQVTVNFVTANGTATTASGDYVAGTGTVTFAPGVVAQSIVTTAQGDTLYEADETFRVNLSGATNATIAVAQGTGTILNDDTAPSITINSPVMTEANSGTKTMTFVASLSAVSGVATTVDFATANGTAIAGSDYTARAGTLTIAAGSLSGNIVITTLGDTVPEANETLFVNLSNATNATIVQGQGTGTITDNDGTVTVTAPNTAVTWTVGSARVITWTTSNNFTAGATFRVELSRNGGTTYELIAASVPNATATSGSYNWTVTGPATTQARVRVTWTVNSRVTDISNSNFTIP